jgi:hypothetical protein
VTRVEALALALADELARHRAVIDAGPRTLTLVVKLDQDGCPFSILFRPEFECKPRRLRKAS